MTREGGAGWSCGGDQNAVAATPVSGAKPKMQKDSGMVGGGGSSYEQIPGGDEYWSVLHAQRLPSHSLAEFCCPLPPPRPT